MRAMYVWLIAVIGVVMFPQAYAWGPDGHHTVATLADKLIAGTHAETEVRAILGTLTLADAAVWADCAKGIDPAMNFTYQTPGKYPECAIYETPQGEAEMADFVRRNATNCTIKPGEEICHKQYHYTDVSIAHTQYQLGLVGTRDDDIVAAVAAAAHVLRDDAAPAPFRFKDKREALLVLAHYAGDIHQPLHVGAIYLSTAGQRVDPDKGTFDPATATRGGNNLLVNGKKLHAMWDAIPKSLTASRVNAAWVAKAKAVPNTPGQLFTWPSSWATDTLGNAQQTFLGVTFGPRTGTHWATTLPSGYSARMSAIKKAQLTAAGAHFAELLEAIWP